MRIWVSDELKLCMKLRKTPVVFPRSFFTLRPNLLEQFPGKLPQFKPTIVFLLCIFMP